MKDKNGKDVTWERYWFNLSQKCKPNTHYSFRVHLESGERLTFTARNVEVNDSRLISIEGPDQFVVTTTTIMQIDVLTNQWEDDLESGYVPIYINTSNE